MKKTKKRPLWKTLLALFSLLAVAAGAAALFIRWLEAQKAATTCCHDCQGEPIDPDTGLPIDFFNEEDAEQVWDRDAGAI